MVVGIGGSVNIPTVSCPHCGVIGVPRHGPFTHHGVNFHAPWPSNAAEEIICQCGRTFFVPYNPDPDVVDAHIFMRWLGASNHAVLSSTTVTAGQIATLALDPPFDVIGAIFLASVDVFLSLVPEPEADGTKIRIVSSVLDPSERGTARWAVLGQPVKVNFTVYGLRDVGTLPVWRQMFYSAMIHAEKRLWRPAFLDYATAFESFIASYLNRHLTRRYDASLAQYLLHRTHSIEQRVDDLMVHATGFKLSESGDLYQRWKDRVHKLRNRVSHGIVFAVGKDDVEEAHQVVYRLIRWVEQRAVL